MGERRITFEHEGERLTLWVDVPGVLKWRPATGEHLRAAVEALRKGPSVEAIAEALYAHDALSHRWGKTWEEVANWERETYLDRARAVLRALGVVPK